MADQMSSTSIQAANAAPVSISNGIQVVAAAAHQSIVAKLQSDLNVANMWITGLEAKIAASYPKSAVLILSICAFVSGVLVKWIF